MKPTDLRGILRYIPRFREKTFVVAVDGAIVTDDNFPNLLLDLAVLRSLSIRIVLVHGAAEQIRSLGEQSGVTPSNLDGAGITDAETLKLALTAANRLTHEILEGLATNDLRAVSTNAIIAHPLGIIGGVDHQFTGKGLPGGDVAETVHDDEHEFRARLDREIRVNAVEFHKKFEFELRVQLVQPILLFARESVGH